MKKLVALIVASSMLVNPLLATSFGDAPTDETVTGESDSDDEERITAQLIPFFFALYLMVMYGDGGE